MERAARLQGRRNFELIFKKGIRLRLRSMNLYYLPEPGDSRRFGVVVPGAAGCAVVRNRIKRRLRHFLQTHVVLMPPVPGILLVQYQRGPERCFGTLHNELVSGLKSLRTCFSK